MIRVITDNGVKVFSDPDRAESFARSQASALVTLPDGQQFKYEYGVCTMAPEDQRTADKRALKKGLGFGAIIGLIFGLSR